MEVLALKKWRQRRLLSIRALAQEANVAPRTVELVERGERTPRGQTVRRLSAALEVEPEQVTEFRRAMGYEEASDAS